MKERRQRDREFLYYQFVIEKRDWNLDLLTSEGRTFQATFRSALNSRGRGV